MGRTVAGSKKRITWKFWFEGEEEVRVWRRALMPPRHSAAPCRRQSRRSCWGLVYIVPCFVSDLGRGAFCLPQEHVVILIHSTLSGKKSVFLDGRPLAKEQKVGWRRLVNVVRVVTADHVAVVAYSQREVGAYQFPFQVGSHLCCVVIDGYVGDDVYSAYHRSCIVGTAWEAIATRCCTVARRPSHRQPGLPRACADDDGGDGACCARGGCRQCRPGAS
jgi:hypothetical protein